MHPIRPAILSFAALTSASAIGQPAPNMEEVRATFVPYASDADLVTLPTGQEVGFTCMGQGSPTVILIPGMGDFGGMAWGNVHPQMAKTTKVCTWDRPGWGLSDGAEGKQTVATTAATLEAALATGKIAGPYVLVGHSLGGLEALLLGDRLREQLAGMVLVDPSVPDQLALMQREAPAMAAEANRQTPGDGFRKCAADNLFYKRPRLINVNEDADPAEGELTGGSWNFFDDTQGRRFSLGANVQF